MLFIENERKSVEVLALLTARDILSTSTSLWDLLETNGDVALTRNLIVVGPDDPPFNGQTYTVGELENRIGFAQLFPQLEDGSFTATRGLSVESTSDNAGMFYMQVRRQVRRREYVERGGRRDVYMYFLDVTSRMCEELVEIGERTLRVESVTRRRGPLFNPTDDEAAQGVFLWADFSIQWHLR